MDTDRYPAAGNPEFTEANEENEEEGAKREARRAKGQALGEGRRAADGTRKATARNRPKRPDPAGQENSRQENESAGCSCLKYSCHFPINPR